MKKNLIVSIIALAILSILIVAGVRQSRYQAENIVEGQVTHVPYSFSRPFAPTYFNFYHEAANELYRASFEETYLSDVNDPTSTVTVSAIIYDEHGRVTTPGAIRPMQRVQIGWDVQPTDAHGGETEVIRFVRILKSKFKLNEIYLFFAEGYLNSAAAISVENAKLLTPAQKEELIRLCEDTAGKTLPLVTYREVNGKKGYYDENGQLYDGDKGKLIFSGQTDEEGNHYVHVSLYYAPLGAYGYSINLSGEDGLWEVLRAANWIS